MKRTIIILSAAITLVAGTIFTGCQSTSQKQEAAQADVRDARQDLNEAQKDANEIRMATAEEWAIFKRDSDVKIRENEVRIIELNGKTSDEVYTKRIANLELQNKEFRTRLTDYEKNQSNWDSFKREFNHDMDELGKSLKDFTIDNSK